MPSNIKHQNFIDLMKAVGMFLIIYGHIVGDPFNLFNQITQPVHTKQIGVAFFIFITGWGLANNTRPALRAVFNRIFPFYVYGILFAVFLSVLFYFLKGDTNPSNYMPYVFGVNVFFNYFPANPTTWYIGTYLHILLFWYFFMQGKTVGKKHLLMAFIAENVVRSVIMWWGQDYVAYMLLPNWLTVFMLGMYYHKKQQLPTTPFVLLLIIAWAGVFVFATIAANAIGFDDTFPFRSMTSDFALSIPVESLLISATYIVHTLFFFEIARRLPGHSVITFFARATLITVIIHIPIIFETAQYFYALFDSMDVARIVFIFVIFIGTAVIAETINRLVDMRAIGNRVWVFVEKVGGANKT
ncbi:MAG TPA: hypothetical protein ENJ08_19870 [Gammaproteobacteria bacterium]|nr:hypothetical protein [Gammaproteobacteria bacterium]